ncbi:phage portal protein [Geothrix sp. 21YS21S-2]|uniref:phage portal protein n=1 Tax=Geothrix sp. 21YS21S-2 TaxID=3068893 RepID=UPI0027B95BCC|nr:phage portal protein [Geothrix sp. 21YS21S-2]
MSRRQTIEAIKAAVQPTLLDEAIGFFSPRLKRERIQNRATVAMIGSWNGGSRSRRATAEWNTPTGSADADLLYDLETMRDRSRDLGRNVPLACGAINTVVTNVIGTGIQARPRINAELLGMTPEEADAWQKNTRREWELFFESTDCDITRNDDGYGLQGIVFRSALESGDVFSLLPRKKFGKEAYGLKIQVIEADRVCNPQSQRETDTFAGGVEMDVDGAPVAYHILRQHPGSIAPSARVWDRVQAYTPRGTRRILHHFDRRRPGQTRGYPYLSPVIELLKQLGHYTDAEVMAAVLNGMFSVFVTSPDGNGLNSVSLNDDSSSPSKDNEVKLGSGSIVDLLPGEKIEIADPKRPNQAFDPFVMAILRQIGVALELPFEVLVKHFTSSYTAARAALQEAWRFFKIRRRWLVKSFCAPVYEAWMEEAVASGRIAAPGFFDDPAIRRAYLGCLWIGDAQSQIDPVKEGEAAALRIETGTSTLEAETIAANGGDWEENAVQQGKERARRKELGLVTDAPVAITGKPTTNVPPGEE